MMTSELAVRLARVALIPALAAMLVLTGCQESTYRARYDVAVTEAVIEENFPEDGPRTSEIAASIEWSVASHAIGARFTNHADTTAMIVWANTTIADESGEEVPLVRVTSPASGPELPQPPTNVPAGGSVAFDCFPVSLAEFEWHPNRSMGGFWRASKGLFGVELDTAAGDDERLALAEAATGRKSRIRVPVMVGARTIVHIFDVRVTGAEVYASYH